MKNTRQIDDTDFIEILRSLPVTQGYTPEQRYQDFRQLFMGSVQGQRVLREILSWGKVFRPAVNTSPIDPYAVAMREGERNMALRLMVTINVEPPTQQSRTRKKPEEKNG